MLPRRNYSIYASLAFLSIAIVAATNAYAQGTGGAVVYRLGNMHEHPWFYVVLGASTVGWLLGTVKGFHSSAGWVGQYWAGPPKALVFLVDLVVFVGIGGYFGTGIFDPSSFPEAVAAGLCWPVGFGALARRD